MIALPKKKLNMILLQLHTRAIDISFSLAKIDISCQGKFPVCYHLLSSNLTRESCAKLFTVNHPNQNVITIRLSNRYLIARLGTDMTQISVDSDASFTISM
jgi:hypothetical protein